MSTQFYYLRTTAYQDYVSGRRAPSKLGRAGVAHLVSRAQTESFNTTNWDELKAIERGMLSCALASEIPVIMTDSSTYGKKYLAVAY